MKVSALQQYLRSLHTAIATSDAASPALADLAAVLAGYDPFADLDLGQFTAFLRQAEAYRAAGAVAVPTPRAPQVEQVEDAVAAAANLAASLTAADLEVTALTARRDAVQRDLAAALTAFLKPLGVGVTLKADAKALQATLAAARARQIAQRLRDALAGVTDAASLAAPAVQERLAGVTEALTVADLKPVAVELGVARPPAQKPALVAALVAKLTGLKPATKRTPKAAAPVDAAAVQRLAVRLKELLEQSLDPEAFGEAEVNAAVAEFEELTVPVLKAVVKEASLEDAGASKAAILTTIRRKLTEARRVRESIEV